MNKGLIMIAVAMMGFFIMGIVLFVISSVIFPPLAAFILFLMICDLVLAFFFLILGFVLDPPSGKVKELGDQEWLKKRRGCWGKSVMTGFGGGKSCLFSP